MRFTETEEELDAVQKGFEEKSTEGMSSCLEHYMGICF